MTREVKRYVEGCNVCQRNKNCTEQPAGKLMPNSIPDKAWTHILADFITKLPLAQGYDSILVVVDQFTKMAHFVPTTEKTTAEGLARLFRDNVIETLDSTELLMEDQVWLDYLWDCYAPAILCDYLTLSLTLFLLFSSL